MTPEQELSYIAAFIDGEGWIIRKPSKTGKIQRTIGFTNTDKQLFHDVIGMLNRTGIETFINFRKSKNPKHSDRWDCVIRGRKNFDKFYKIIPLHHKGKKERLKEIIEDFLTNDSAQRQRAPNIWTKEQRKRRSDITKLAAQKRWAGHKPKKPRQRTLNKEQRERHNLLARLRRIK